MEIVVLNDCPILKYELGTRLPTTATRIQNVVDLIHWEKEKQDIYIALLKWEDDTLISEFREPAPQTNTLLCVKWKFTEVKVIMV